MRFNFQSLRKIVPWYVKFLIKIVRGVLPLPYDFFASLGLFRHGKMDNPDYAIATFENHFPGLKEIPKNPWVFLEIGPGDSLASGIIASSKGAKMSYLIDSGDYMTKDVSKYLNLVTKVFGADYLATKKFESINDIKKEFNIIQMTEGVTSLKTISDKVVDLSFSNACLEHVASNEVEDLFKELKRISRPGAISSHFIDYKDHLEYSLNNLRFSKEFWEKEIIKKSGIYTNRIRFCEMKTIIEKAGFSCEITKLGKWDILPLAENKLHKDFKSFKKDDLLVKEAWVRLT